MKAMYRTPRIEIMKVATGALLDTPAISGGNVQLGEGGQATGTTKPKAPKPLF